MVELHLQPEELEFLVQIIAATPMRIGGARLALPLHDSLKALIPPKPVINKK